MAKQSELFKSSSQPEASPFSKKAALILFELLTREDSGAASTDQFSLNEIARKLTISPSTAHRAVSTLEYEGVLSTQGMRTNKRYQVKNPKKLLTLWLEEYSVSKKCRSRQFSISDPNYFSKSIERLQKKGAIHPALHTAARELFKVQVTNLRGAEYYLPEWDDWYAIAKELGLVEQERGYDVLLLEPYYAKIVNEQLEAGESQQPSRKYGLLTFLDLYHFPLRGREQAEALYRKLPFLSRICPWGEMDDIS